MIAIFISIAKISLIYSLFYWVIFVAFLFIDWIIGFSFIFEKVLIRIMLVLLRFFSTPIHDFSFLTLS